MERWRWLPANVSSLGMMTPTPVSCADMVSHKIRRVIVLDNPKLAFPCGIEPTKSDGAATRWRVGRTLRVLTSSLSSRKGIPAGSPDGRRHGGFLLHQSCQNLFWSCVLSTGSSGEPRPVSPKLVCQDHTYVYHIYSVHATSAVHLPAPPAVPTSDCPGRVIRTVFRYFELPAFATRVKKD